MVNLNICSFSRKTYLNRLNKTESSFIQYWRGYFQLLAYIVESHTIELSWCGTI